MAFSCSYLLLERTHGKKFNHVKVATLILYHIREGTRAYHKLINFGKILDPLLHPSIFFCRPLSLDLKKISKPRCLSKPSHHFRCKSIHEFGNIKELNLSVGESFGTRTSFCRFSTSDLFRRK